MNLKRVIDTLKSYDFRTYNFRLVLYVVALTILGINIIGSATDDESYVSKQIMGLIIGLVAMLIVSLIRYDFIARYYWLMYIVTVLMLIAVLTPLGHEVNGAQRWIVILNRISVQPSELAKILLILFFSALFARNAQAVNSWKFLIFAGVTIAIPIGLILLEPDLSTSVVTLTVICAIIFVSSLQAKFIKRIVLIIIPVLAVLLTLVIVLPPEKNIIPTYQYNRLIGFYDKDNEVAEQIRYQQENSVIAISSGSLTGKGLNNSSSSSVKNADFISEPQTDFIFTIAGEELGFAGSIAIVFLLALIVFECFLIGMRAREQIGKAIAIGYGTLIGIQSFINMAVVTMLVPNTGLTLPFVSAGISSLVVLYFGLGIVLNVGIRKKITF